MTERLPWLERRFETGMPTAMFPNMVERLRGTPARIEDRVRNVAAEVLRGRVGDSWSILENVGHLWLTEELWSGRLDDFQARRAELRAARFESWRVDDARFNSRDIDYLCADFRRARGTLVRRLEQLDPGVLGHLAVHPRLNQPMNVVDLMVFIAEHDDHHLARITELIEAQSTLG